MVVWRFQPAWHWRFRDSWRVPQPYKVYTAAPASEEELAFSLKVRSGLHPAISPDAQTVRFLNAASAGQLPHAENNGTQQFVEPTDYMGLTDGAEWSTTMTQEAGLRCQMDLEVPFTISAFPLAPPAPICD